MRKNNELIQALETARNGGSSARILFVGHSHVAGQGSGTGSSGTIGAGEHGVGEYLARELSRLGIHSCRVGWMADYNTSVDSTPLSSADSRLALGSGWLSVTNSFCLGGTLVKQDPYGSGTFDYVPGFKFNAATIWYPENPGLSPSMGVYVDGAYVESINELSSATVMKKKTIAFGGDKKILQFKNLGASGSSYVFGVEFAPSVRPDLAITIAGSRGMRTSDLAYDHGGFASLKGIGAVAPDCTVIYSLTNDILNNTNPATLKSNLATLRDKALETGVCVIVIDPVPDTSIIPDLPSTIVNDYVNVVHELADGIDGVEIADCRATFGPDYVSASGKGLMFNGNHPSRLGHEWAASEIAKAIYRLVN